MRRRTIVGCCVSAARSRSLTFFNFSPLVRGNRSRKLILDLAGVPYIDSAGIGALVGAYVNHQKDGRSLALVGVGQRVRDALQVTRVEQFFQFYESEAAARQAWRTPAASTNSAVLYQER